MIPGIVEHDNTFYEIKAIHLYGYIRFYLQYKFKQT